MAVPLPAAWTEFLMPQSWVDLPFTEAVAYLRALAPTPRDVFDTMSEESRQLAFTVSRISKMTVLQEVLDSLREAAQSGKTLEEFVSELELTGLSPAHLETVYRTNLQSAFGRGNFEKLTDPTLGGAFWGWRYKTVGDDRVRDSHRVLDGLTFKTGAHDEVYPPWDFNCRCAPEPITRREARNDAIESDELPAEAQDALSNTEFASPALGLPYQPDLSGFDLGLISQFVGDQEGKAGV
jgi:SPP1 gp7 family putative phage head morphogenesis protein